MVDWSKGIKCPIVLGFDVDGITGAINRNPKTAHLPSLMSMREYGPSIATPRILDLLESKNLKASFYIPGYIAETHIDLVQKIHSKGHEIGHHGYMHEPPATLSKLEEGDILDRGTKSIETITGETPKGYRSPSWELSEHSLELLQERNFEYDSSLMGNDIPYNVAAGTGELVEIPVHWELDDHPFFNYSPALGNTTLMASPDHVFETWSSAFEGLYELKRSFVLTMHPWIIGRPSRLNMLTKLIDHINEFEGVSFMTALDLAKLHLEINHSSTIE